MISSAFIDIVGRFFLSVIFLIEGINKIFNYEITIQYMNDYSVHEYLIIPTIIVEILFSLLLIVGYQTKFSSLVLGLFAIVTALIFHNDFSNPMQLISFLKNFAISGGLMIVFINGPKKYSVDYKLS